MVEKSRKKMQQQQQQQQGKGKGNNNGRNVVFPSITIEVPGGESFLILLFFRSVVVSPHNNQPPHTNPLPHTPPSSPVSRPNSPPIRIAVRALPPAANPSSRRQNAPPIFPPGQQQQQHQHQHQQLLLPLNFPPLPHLPLKVPPVANSSGPSAKRRLQLPPNEVRPPGPTQHRLEEQVLPGDLRSERNHPRELFRGGLGQELRKRPNDLRELRAVGDNDADGGPSARVGRRPSKGAGRGPLRFPRGRVPAEDGGGELLRSEGPHEDFQLGVHIDPRREADVQGRGDHSREGGGGDEGWGVASGGG